MEVLAKDFSDSPVLLSNAEVVEMLQQRITERTEIASKQKRRKSVNSKYKHRDWIEEHVFDYLKSTPCMNLDASKRKELQSQLMSSKKKPSGDGKSSKTSGFGLTEAESLQVLNFMPSEKVEIHLMVEELHARMTEQSQEELLSLIQSYSISRNVNDTTKEGQDGDTKEDERMLAVKEEM